jgi:endoglucanase
MDDVLPVFRLRLWLGIVWLLMATGYGFAKDLRIAEVTIATPDMISVEIKDPNFKHGAIIELEGSLPQPVGTWIAHRDTWGMVIGPERRHLRLADTPPAELLDRAVVDQVDGYRLNGQPAITSVYRKSLPYDSGFYRSSSGRSRTAAAMKHQVFLKLSHPLEPGTHTLSWPGDLFSETTFTYDPSITRALGIRSTQVGHAPEDHSKKAYLALWVPGGLSAGAIDFRSYGLARFSILDEAGSAVYSADMKLKSLPDAKEPWNGLGSPLIDYAALGERPVPVTGIETSGTSSITVPGHDFQTGERIVLQRLSGAEDAAAVFATVGAVSLETIEILDSQSALPPTVAPGATARRAYSANRAGTYVFEMDYSDWVPKPNGSYRVRVDGLGVSDVFQVSSDHWKDIGRSALGGLYNHRSGIALDGRFGFKRPAAFVPGLNVEIAESTLPLSFSSHGTLGLVPFEDAANSTWRNGKLAGADYWGGYMDAGDWDRHIVHLRVSRLFLDLLDYLPADRLRTSYGIPKSSEYLDPELYAGTDDLPDLLHEAIWTIDFFRRLQGPDGTVRGGIESAGHPLLGTASFLETLPVFTYAPDISSTYTYAAIAGSLARHLEAYGQPELAAVYMDSASRAWDAAEAGFSDLDAFYADAVAGLVARGYSDSEGWPEIRIKLKAEAETLRVAAASSLYRTTGELRFRTAAEERLRENWDLYLEKSDAAWDYMNSSETDQGIRKTLENLFKSETALLLEAQETNTYPSMKHPYAPAGWGQGGPPDSGIAQLAMRTHMLTGDNAITGLVLETLNGLLGANQTGMSLMTGVGARQILHPLHEDHRAMGVQAPPGIIIYGWAPANAFAYGWIFGPSWSPLAEVGLTSQSQNTKVEPSRFAIPYFENLIEFPDVIIQQEYTVHQTIGPVAALALYLDGQVDAD